MDLHTWVKSILNYNKIIFRDFDRNFHHKELKSLENGAFLFNQLIKYENDKNASKPSHLCIFIRSKETHILSDRLYQN